MVWIYFVNVGEKRFAFCEDYGRIGSERWNGTRRRRKVFAEIEEAELGSFVLDSLMKLRVIKNHDKESKKGKKLKGNLSIRLAKISELKKSENAEERLWALIGQGIQKKGQISPKIKKEVLELVIGGEESFKTIQNAICQGYAEYQKQYKKIVSCIAISQKIAVEGPISSFEQPNLFSSSLLLMPQNDPEEDAFFESSDKTVRIKIWGDYACFTRPECKVERVSYEAPTPSAARNILNCVLWKPEMRWNVLKITILNQIKFISFKRNELQHTISFKKQWTKDPLTMAPFICGAGSDESTPRNTVALRDVAYIIEAEPIILSNNPHNNKQKYISMFNRRVEKGQSFTCPFLGCREFAAFFSPVNESEKPIKETRQLGCMLYDIAFGKEENVALFFEASLKNGVMNTDMKEVLSTQQKEAYICSFKN